MAYRHLAKYTRGEGEDQPPSLSVRDVVGRSYNESYVAARTNFVPQKARSGRRPIESRQAFNMKRTENLRITRGKDAMQQITESLDAKLGMGLKEVEDALNQIEANKP